MRIKPTGRVEQIEGLRAISVLLVLIYHIDRSWLPSGYLGVDAFFGISGYVVTRMIAIKQESGLFTLSGFYASRIARLLPSLLAVVLLSLGVFSFIYGQDDLQNLSFSAIASTISLSNVFFYFDSGYFSEEAIYKPLLHTWSLGVEEQFYLVWPALLIVLASKRLLTPLIMFLLGVGIFSLTLTVSTYDSDLTFYFSPFRMHQFFLGAGFALLAIKGSHHRLPPAKWGTDVIIISLMVLMSLIEYPFGIIQTVAHTMMALLAAGACFLADHSNNTTSSRPHSILSLKPVTYIGSRSYAIYLVHWPIIAATFAITTDNNIDVVSYKWLVFITSIFAGIILSALVERPLRFNKRDTGHSKRLKLVVVTGLVITSLLGATLLLRYSSLERPTPSDLTISSKSLRKELKLATDERGCYFKLTDKTFLSPDLLKNCILPNQNNVLIVGDSLSRGVYIGLKNHYKNTNIVRVFVPGCPPYFGRNDKHIQTMSNNLKTCRVIDGNPWGYVKELIQLVPFDLVLVAGYWQAKNLGEASIIDSIRSLNDIGSPIGLIGVRPSFSSSAIRLANSGKISPLSSNDLKPYLYTTRGLPPPAELNSKLKTITEKYSNVQYIDIFSALCPDDCPAFVSDKILFLDDKHLTLFGANHVAKLKVYDSVMNTL